MRYKYFEIFLFILTSSKYHDNIHQNIHNMVQKTIESSFNYSGQKCSACSIVYVPENYLDYFLILSTVSKLTNPAL